MLAALLLALLLANTGCRTTASQRALAADDELEQRVEAHAHFAAGVVHELAEDTPAALKEFYLAAEADPEDAELLLEVSGRLIEGRQFAQALDVLTWATELPEADGMAFVRLGFVYAQLGQNAKSIQANQLAVQRLPGYLPARHNLYLNFVQARQPERALAVLDEAAAQPGTDLEYLVNLAELYSNCGRQFPELQARVRPKAIAVLDRAAALRPSAGPLQFKLAENFNLLGATNQAAKWYLEILEHGEPGVPLRDILRAKLADIFLRGEDRLRAEEQLAAIVRDNPANAGAHYFLGALAFEGKRWEEAITSFRQALLYDPGFEQAYFDLASAQIAAGKSADGVVTLELLRKQKPASFASEYLLGTAYHEQKKFAEALTHLKTAETIAHASETNRLNTSLYFQLGATCEQMGDRAAAEAYFEKSLALAPDNAEALNYLGFMWAEQGRNLPRARELIEHALKLEPDNDAFLDSMGWVLFKSGDAGGAVEYLLKAVAKLEQPDATVYDHLGDAYAALKQMDKAREAWAKSVSIETSEAVRKKLDSVKP